MESTPHMPVSTLPVGHLSNGGKQRYLLEAYSTTGFVAWRMADGTTLINQAMRVSLKPSPSVSFWSCASYTNTTPAGDITAFDCHGNGLTTLNITALASLQYLDCCHNKLRELALDGLTDLQAAEADHNRLTSLEVRHLRTLRVLNCASNRLQQLDVSGLGSLQVLDCAANPLVSLKCDGCTQLRECKSPKGASNCRCPF